MPELQLELPGRMEDRGFKAVRALLFLALLLAVSCFAQQAGQPPVPKSSVPPPFSQNSIDDLNFGPAEPLWQEKQLRILNAERQKELVADTGKLLKLAHELDAEISNKNPDSLTPEQLRKIAEIEKLAHSVKEKMSTSVRGAPPAVFSVPLNPH
jgi:hypothetical protein